MLKDILRTLQSMEGLLRDLLLELKERRKSAPVETDPVKLNWLEQGIDNIMGFQAGKKKRGDSE